MAQYTEFRERSFKAGADLSAKQYWAVKIDTTTQNQVLLASGSGDDTNAGCIGILKNAPKSGEVANVVMFGSEGTMKVIAFGAISLGAEVAIEESDGRFSTAESGDFVCGIALEAAAAQGDIIEIALTKYKK
jgi:hypothetical protein